MLKTEKIYFDVFAQIVDWAKRHEHILPDREMVQLKTPIVLEYRCCYNQSKYKPLGRVLLQYK